VGQAGRGVEDPRASRDRTSGRSGRRRRRGAGGRCREGPAHQRDHRRSRPARLDGLRRGAPRPRRAAGCLRRPELSAGDRGPARERL